jgi:adenylate kinase family enzyme
MKEIKEMVASGKLLDDDDVNKIVKPKLIEAMQSGIIFDGYPRTLK